MRYAQCNEAFDVVEQHEGGHYSLCTSELESKFGLSNDYESGYTYHIVQEDIHAQPMEARALLARNQAPAENDGPAIKPSGGMFGGLQPGMQYRLICEGTLRCASLAAQLEQAKSPQ